MHHRLLFAAIILLCSLLVSCGGNGESSNSNSTPEPGTEKTPTSPNPQETPTSPNTPSAPANPNTPSFQLDESARFNHPGDIVGDVAGNLYVMDRANKSIRKIAADGVVSTIPGGFDENSRIAVDASDNLIVLSGVDVFKVTPDGARTPIVSYPVQPGSYTPLGVSADSKGKIYILLRYRNIFRIERINSYGTEEYVYYIINYGYNGSIASDTAGNIATSVIPPTSGYIGGGLTFIEYIPLSAQTSESVHAEGIVELPVNYSYIPERFGTIAFDASGNLYAAGGTYTYDANASSYTFTSIRIAKISPNGTLTELYNGFPNGSTVPYTFYTSTPITIGVAVDANGDIILSDPFSCAIYRIGSSGQASLVAGKPNNPGSTD